MIQRFRKVDDGLYRGSAPSISDVQNLKDQFNINKIVSLDKISGDKIDRACNLLGINHIKLYIENIKDVGKLLKYNLRELLIKGGPTFFHCYHGKDRTGLLCALYQIKYMGISPNKAIQEAKSLGFGLGVPPKIVRLYEHIIHACQPEKDTNKADIVSNERGYIGDNRDSFLDESRQSSFSPYLDHTKQAPIDCPYNYIMEQSPTRQNYQQYKDDKKKINDEDGENMPLVGLYNNDAGVKGFGPAADNGGFIYD